MRSSVVIIVIFPFRENELSNVEIIVADISKFEMERSFDRIISIEMFEVQINLVSSYSFSIQGKGDFVMAYLFMQHMKNYKALLKKLSRWMKEDSLLFVHYFCHKTFAYHFEVTNIPELFSPVILSWLHHKYLSCVHVSVFVLSEV